MLARGGGGALGHAVPRPNHGGSYLWLRCACLAPLPKRHPAPEAPNQGEQAVMSGGEAFGHPGSVPNWTSSAKQGIGTALSAASPVWFSLGHGILNEIYFPGVDTANTRDVQYLVSDDATFMHEEKRHMKHSVEYSDARALAYCQTNTDRLGRYRIVKQTITDSLAP